MRSRLVLAITLVLSASCLVSSAPAGAAVGTKTVEQTFPATGLVKIANLAGHVILTPAANGPVKVVAVVNAEGETPQETQDLLGAMRWVQEHDGTWNLAYPVDRYDAFVYPEGLRSFGNNTSTKFRGERVRVYGSRRRDVPTLYANLTITVPNGANLRVAESVGGIAGSALTADLSLDTGSGSVKIDGASGRLSIDTGSGDVELRQIAGDTSADTGSGEIVVDGIAADTLKADTGSGGLRVNHATLRSLVADSGSGDIRLDDVKLETLVADTGSGDVTVRGDLSGATKIDVDTGSGDVELAGGPDFEFDLTTDVGSGDVSVTYDDAQLRLDRHDIIGARRGSARTHVFVDTGSGDVTLTPGAAR
jgi:putative adhesin